MNLSVYAMVWQGMAIKCANYFFRISPTVLLTILFNINVRLTLVLLMCLIRGLGSQSIREHTVKVYKINILSEFSI